MTTTPSFADLGLPDAITQSLASLGYETPTPIQAEAIPALLNGRDIVGQAQTGTGKTAAFALPTLAGIDPKVRKPQVLVLAPTRELANQVAEAFSQYATAVGNLRVATLCGGQSYRPQLDALRAGAQVVVGTPGRVMDHMRRNSLPLDSLAALVLDEADEMLRMGFIDDVEWILEQSPKGRQLALFSATMPDPIRRIAKRHLVDPAQITIKAKTRTAVGVRQRVLEAPGMGVKNEALARLFEVESVDGVIVFVRTKASTVEVTEMLQSRGFRAAALSGDVDQALRERTVEHLKVGKIDVVVATDVAARGLDVERISHVINYDAPTNAETYIHRIGRTGRAGREGDAILFVAPRERRVVQTLERATRQKIDWMEMPDARAINKHRVKVFKDSVLKTSQDTDISFFKQLVEEMQVEHGLDPIDAAAAIATQLQGERPFLAKDSPKKPRPKREERGASHAKSSAHFNERQAQKENRKPGSRRAHNDEDLTTYRLEVGAKHRVKPGNIVGAIANEAGLNSKNIGRIAINHDHTFIDLPEGMPKAILKHLKKVRVAGQQIQITRATA